MSSLASTATAPAMKVGQTLAGARCNKVPLYRSSWCIAKLMRVFPGWAGPLIENDVHQCEFKLGKALIEESEPEILKVSSLEDEM